MTSAQLERLDEQIVALEFTLKYLDNELAAGRRFNAKKAELVRSKLVDVRGGLVDLYGEVV